MSLVFVKSLTVYLGGHSASQKLHNDMLRNIIACPMSFFDTTAVGRIVTRFSSDIDVIDSFPDTVKQFVECSLAFVVIPMVICYHMPWFIITIVPLLAVYISLQVSYQLLTLALYIGCHLECTRIRIRSCRR